MSKTLKTIIAVLAFAVIALFIAQSIGAIDIPNTLNKIFGAGAGQVGIKNTEDWGSVIVTNAQ